MKYKIGLVVGRFQPITAGQQLLINTALENCKKVIILVLSSDKSRTYKNPFSYSERKEMIQKTFSDNLNNIEILPLPDKEIYSNAERGRYMLSEIKDKLNQHVDVFITTTPKVTRFDSSMKIISVNRDVKPTTGDEIRDKIVLGKSLDGLIPEAIMPDIDKMTEIVIDSFMLDSKSAYEVN